MGSASVPSPSSCVLLDAIEGFPPGVGPAGSACIPAFPFLGGFVGCSFRHSLISSRHSGFVAQYTRLFSSTPIDAYMASRSCFPAAALNASYCALSSSGQLARRLLLLRCCVDVCEFSLSWCAVDAKRAPSTVLPCLSFGVAACGVGVRPDVSPSSVSVSLTGCGGLLGFPVIRSRHPAAGRIRRLASSSRVRLASNCLDVVGAGSHCSLLCSPWCVPIGNWTRARGRGGCMVSGIGTG